MTLPAVGANVELFVHLWYATTIDVLPVRVLHHVESGWNAPHVTVGPQRGSEAAWRTHLRSRKFFAVEWPVTPLSGSRLASLDRERLVQTIVTDARMEVEVHSEALELLEAVLAAFADDDLT